MPPLVAIGSPAIPAAMAPVAGTSPNAQGASVAFSVRYRFAEWEAFVRAHLAATLQGKGKLRTDGRLPWLVRAALALMLRPMFAYKKRRLPVCHFVITPEGITREAAGELHTYPWSKVTGVVRYAPGFLLCLATGAMPIPLRCLNEAQQLQLESLLVAHADVRYVAPMNSGGL